MPKYKLKISFKSDKKLSEDQVADLMALLSLQIEEPQTIQGEPEDYSTSKITVKVK